MELKTKFNLGDVVSAIESNLVFDKVHCKVCNGTGIATVKNYSKGVTCPECHGAGYTGEKSRYAFRVRTRSAIGKVSVEVYAGGVRDERYMLESTGIGTGSVYPADRLFLSDEEARAECEKRAAEYNAKYIKDGKLV